MVIKNVDMGVISHIKTMNMNRIAYQNLKMTYDTPINVCNIST